jgi:hypothetical protein
MKPRSLNDTADELFRLMDEKPIDRVDTVNQFVRGFSAQTLRDAEKYAKEFEGEWL